MGLPIRVDLASLRTLGGEVLALGDKVKGDTAAVSGRLVPPAGPGVAGWSAFSAVSGASSGWHEYLAGLAGRLEQAGQALIDAANNYSAADERATSRHGRIMAEP